ncbi:T9SS type A sorting domain-containing protein [Winogradskyella wichelsiae]|uniref:T9SS type A sorting domain-containing protein n=1 Tax=Winogradskyella wichelsiae TaxID=2697007 RepID=UPI003EFB1DE4
MKQQLLFALLFVTALGFSQSFDNIPTGTGYYINKLIVSPNGADLTNELIEVRGPANEVIPEDLWLLVIDGDGNASNYGKVTQEIQLGDGIRTFGANGIFAIVCNYTDENSAVVTTNPYASLMDSDASVLTIELTGNDVTGGSSNNVSSQTPDIGYNGNFADASGSYMLIQGENPDGVAIDGPDAGDGLAFDGVIDSVGPHTLWTLYDSVAYLDDDIEDGLSERGYAQIVFAQDMSTNGANQTATTSATVIDFPGSDPHIIIRQGTNTGFTTNDWAIGDTDGDSPDWELDEDDTLPAAFRGWASINTVYGALNPTSVTLSTESFELKGFSIYPNPADTSITITSLDQTIDSVELFNVLGRSVLRTSGLTNDTVDVSQLASGIYLLKIKSGINSVTKRIIIE